MFRWKGIIFLLVLIGLVFVAGFFLDDLWLERQIEKFASSANRAKVEIDRLDFSIFGPHLSWERLQVTNPSDTWRNSVETGKCEFEMEFLPLLSKKVIVNNVQFSNIRTNTARTSDGFIEQQEESQAEQEDSFVSNTMENLEKEVAATEAGQIAGQVKDFNIDSVMTILQINTPQRIDSLSKQLDKTFTDLNSKLSEEHWQNQLKEVETTIKSMNTKNIKKTDDAAKLLSQLKQVNGKIDAVKKEINDTKSSVSNELKTIKNSPALVSQWVEDDYRRAYSLAKLPNVDTQSIARILFGAGVVGRVNQVLGYVNEARYYSNKIKSDEPKKESPPRLKGQDIHFYRAYELPEYWIKKVDLSGMTETEFEFSGIVENIVSDQRYIGKTTDAFINGKRRDAATFTLTAKLDYLEEVPKESFSATFKDYPLVKVALNKSKFLPSEVEKGWADIDAGLNLAGDQIQSTIKFTAHNLTLTFSEEQTAKTEFEKAVQDIIRSIDLLNLTAQISGDKDNLQFNLNSNLDELVAQRLKAMLGEKVAAMKKKLQDRVDKEVQKHKAELNEFLTQQEMQISDKMKQADDMLQKYKNLSDAKKKEIEDQVKKLKLNLGDKLKGLF